MKAPKLKTFTYKGELYIRVVPSKRLFNSTTVHEVVNRGDVFAMRVSDQVLTIIPGRGEVTHSEHSLTLAPPVNVPAERAKLRDLARTMKYPQKELFP